MPATCTCAPEIQSFEDLRQYIYQIICEQFQLQPGAFSLTQRILTRGGNICGVFFCVHGPRSVKFSAIWEIERNQILFYDPAGVRFLRVQLRSRPDWQQRAA
ncbi:MAG: hypothetical protein NZ602_17255 [Thermoguttaceae bacterium]|nr:hypothetical protein [Thermoguttaceae bacterium]MDW8037653.1 hypothetical protein [Thermoguttaceae bacterium]